MHSEEKYTFRKLPNATWIRIIYNKDGTVKEMRNARVISINGNSLEISDGWYLFYLSSSRTVYIAGAHVKEAFGLLTEWVTEYPINGWNLGKATVEMGEINITFTQEDKGTWVERYVDNSTGETRGNTFTETFRDDWSVHLYDEGRKMNLYLDMYRKKVGFSFQGQGYQDLYNISEGE